LRKQRFSIEIDEATNFSGTGNLIAYVRCVEDTTINEDLFFYISINRRATAK
jgi:hypothetical protein